MRRGIARRPTAIVAALAAVMVATTGALAGSPTGHEPAPEFRAFYERSGGLPVFGYALGAASVEKGRTVQYFERQRLEHYPENAGSPYEVLLGRLGVSEAAALGLLETEPFKQLPEGTGSDEHCIFFAESGHRLCHGFKSYWRRHGLDLGDDGVSFRESLALFGYPISEEFRDPVSGLTVQYFERARFEYQPEHAGTEHEVLLGRLGAAAWARLGESGGEPAAPAASETTPPASTSATAGNPFAGAVWFIDPDSNARKQADAWRASRPADAARMDQIAAQPQADWFGDWSGDVAAAVGRRVTQITAEGALPVLVAYNIPRRDCAAGGAPSGDAYRQWIRDFARGIDDRRAIVILEPDALALLDCLTAGERQARLALLDDAVGVLASTNATVYVDAGHGNWIAAATMAERLRQVGIERARGVSLNVSNFSWTSDESAYLHALRSHLGQPIQAVIDTSRNGLGPAPDREWCNPPGRALGTPPTTDTGDEAVDAWLWVKPPGESDGACNGGPPAGVWWADYALGLARRAGH